MTLGTTACPVESQRTEVGVDGKTTREIVIEIEQVRLVRKRAVTVIGKCEECGARSDFVGLAEAARLFEVRPLALLEFMKQNDCHFIQDEFGDKQICLNALLDRMKAIHDAKGRGGASDRILK